MNTKVKVIFELEQDEDGYPPFSSEGVWASPISDNVYKIDNIPFYVQDLSVDDIVLASDSGNGLCYVKTAKKSDNSTIRVISYDETAKQELLEQIPTFGCDFEIGVPTNLIAINVPANAKVDALLDFLNLEGADDKLDYEESAPRYLDR